LDADNNKRIKDFDNPNIESRHICEIIDNANKAQAGAEFRKS